MAALRGSREIAFTILSITLSLVAVFIPVLFMGGIVGRLFREFAVTISMTILISGLVSLTLTPMLCSRLLRAGGHSEKHGVVYRALESGFEGMLKAYKVTLALALQYRLVVLVITVLSILATYHLAVVVPKGFFPIEDTGLISVSVEGPEDMSFAAMTVAQKEVAAIMQADPAVSFVNSTVGTSGFGAGGENNGSMFIALKPLKERKVSIQQIIQRLRTATMKVPAVNVYLTPIQNINVGGRSAKSLYQLTLQAVDLDELEKIAPELEKRMAAMPFLQGVTSDLEVSNPQFMVDIDRDRRRRSA